MHPNVKGWQLELEAGKTGAVSRVLYIETNVPIWPHQPGFDSGTIDDILQAASEEYPDATLFRIRGPEERAKHVPGLASSESHTFKP